MNTITRYGIKSEFVAPERVPAFSRRWQRAMSALNLADDQRHLTDASAQDAAERRSVLESKLTELDMGRYHASLAHLTEARSLGDISTTHVEPTTGPIVTNGPNTLPTAHSMFAVGPEVAA